MLVRKTNQEKKNKDLLEHLNTKNLTLGSEYFFPT